MENSNSEREQIWLLSSDLMLATGADGSILATNPSWADILGWEEAELRTIKFQDLVHPDDVQQTINQTTLLTEDNPAGRLDNRCRHKDGSYRSISWSTVANGKSVYAIGRAGCGESHGGSPTESMEEANRGQKLDAVAQFAGVLAHDFNNLLQRVVASMELVRKLIEMGRAAETERFIDASMASVKRAAILTERLHMFSNRQPPDPTVTDANAMISSMEEKLRRSVTPLINLKFSLADGLWRTLCDPKQFENALMHLVTNAREAMPEGGEVLVASSNVSTEQNFALLTEGIAPGQYVCIAVTDKGTGMKEEVLRQAFDPLFTTKPAGLATGLGLSTVFRWVRQLKGYVRICSEIGSGSTVKLYLPRCRGND